MIEKIDKITKKISENIDISFKIKDTNTMSEEQYFLYIKKIISRIKKTPSDENFNKIEDSLSIFGPSNKGLLLSYEFLETMRVHLDDNFINILQNNLAENSKLASLVPDHFPKPSHKIEDKYYLYSPIEGMSKRRLFFLTTIYSPLKNVIGHSSTTRMLNSYLLDNEPRFDYEFDDFRRNLNLYAKVLFIYPRHAKHFGYEIDKKFLKIISRAEEITDNYLLKLEKYNPFALKRVHSLLSSKSIVQIMLKMNQGLSYTKEVNKYKQDLFILANSSQMYTSFIPPSKVANDLIKLTLFIPELSKDKEIRDLYYKMVMLALDSYNTMSKALNPFLLSQHLTGSMHRILPIMIGDNFLTFNAALNAGAFLDIFNCETYNTRSSYLNFISYFSFRYRKVFNDWEDFKKIPDVNLNKIFF